MMKRLVAMLLVICLASTANAVLLQVDGVSATDVEIAEGAVLTITVVGEDASSWLGYLLVDPGGAGALSNPQVLPAAGELATAVPYSDPDGTGYMLTTAASPVAGTEPISAGDQFNLDYSGGTAGQSATISLFIDPEYSTPAATLNVSIVPEPMTIALLSLGALFLRKRK
jgi:hypothetical protein